MSAAATRAVVVLREVPTASVLVALHRLLGLGITDIRSRTEAGDPLIDVELFANDHEDVEQTLRTLLTHIEGLEHSVHVCLGDEGPCTECVDGRGAEAHVVRSCCRARARGCDPG